MKITDTKKWFLICIASLKTISLIVGTFDKEDIDLHATVKKKKKNKVEKKKIITKENTSIHDFFKKI